MALSVKGKRRHRKHSAMAEINVTPMVDVMLVLLVIFMVAAPLLTTGVPVNLPESQAPALPQEQEPPLAVTLDAQGNVFIQETQIERAELASKLTAILAERQSDKIYVRSDGENSYANVFALMGELSAAGFHNIGLVGEASGQ